jgi:hypothetical protein
MLNKRDNILEVFPMLQQQIGVMKKSGILSKIRIGLALALPLSVFSVFVVFAYNGLVFWIEQSAASGATFLETWTLPCAFVAFAFLTVVVIFGYVGASFIDAERPRIRRDQFCSDCFHLPPRPPKSAPGDRSFLKIIKTDHAA